MKTEWQKITWTSIEIDDSKIDAVFEKVFSIFFCEVAIEEKKYKTFINFPQEDSNLIILHWLSSKITA